jgi:hypothetical protein
MSKRDKIFVLPTQRKSKRKLDIAAAAHYVLILVLVLLLLSLSNIFSSRERDLLQIYDVK